MVNAKNYYGSLKAHFNKLLNNLVLEEDDKDGTASATSYTHRGILVKSVSEQPRNTTTTTATTQDGATSTSSQPNNGESTLTLTANSTETSTETSTATTSTATSNNAAVNRIEETPDTPDAQKTPDAVHPPPNPTGESTATVTGEPVEVTGRENVNEASPMKDPLSDIEDSTLEEIVNSISDAYDGLINEPFLAYSRTAKTLKNSAALVESFIESKYAQKTEEALDLVLKDKKVTPPVLNGVIQKQLEPVKKDIKNVQRQVQLSRSQKRNLLRKEAKKRKQLEHERVPDNSEDNSEDDVDAAPAKSEQQRKKKRKKNKKSKNSNSHPEIAPSVTQKKNQKTDKNGKGNQDVKKKKNGKQNGDEPTPTTPSQQRGRKSKKQFQKKNGGK